MDCSEPLTGPNPPIRKDIGFLFVGHGTRSQAGQKQFREVFSQYSELLSGSATELCFLELAGPDIATAVARMAAKQVERLVTIPVLLFSAGHAQLDIPQEVEKAAKNVGIRVVSQSPPLSCAPSILDLSAIRFRQAVCRDSRSLRCQGGCSGEYCRKTGLVMVGRGSQSDTATAQMRKFTELRCEMTPVMWQSTGFIHGQVPTVEEALDQLQQSDCDFAVVQPHLLFEGQLMQHLRQRVAERQRSNPLKKWVMTDSLGVDRRLAEALVSLSIDHLPRNETAVPGFSN